MRRPGRLVFAAAAVAFAAAWWAGREAPHAAPPRRESPLPARVARRGAGAVPAGETFAAVPARSPRPGRSIAYFRAPSRGTDLARIARDLIERNRRELGLDAMPGELRVVREFASLGGHHLRFEQTVDGVPVFASEVSAHVTRDGRPLLVQADVFPVAGVETSPRVGADAARAAALEWVSDDEVPAAAESKDPRLVILPEGRRGRLAWRVDVRTPTESSRVFVDAADGEVVRSDSLRVGATGVGRVFDPNPIYALRDGSLKDGQDRDTAMLGPAYVIVTLPRLDETGFLRGAWADVTPTEDAVRSTVFDWTGISRADPAFEQVMAYYHVDRAQQRLQDLGVTGANDEPQRLDAHGLAADQSFYDVFDDVIRLGDGGVDDGEDADIIRHEYGHALQFAQVPDFGITDEGSSMGEGFGDFHAASFHSSDPAFDPLVGSWDAASYSNANPPYLRRVDGTKRYPENLKGEPHADGEIWSRFLWDLRALVGADDALRLVVESHFLLTASARFTQGANAVLLANESLRDGEDDVAIRDLLDARGLLYTVPLAHPPADDALEPNDDLDHPALLAPGSYPGLVSADDDWYVLHVPTNRRFHVTMTLDPESANLDLALYAQTGPTTLSNDLVAVSSEIGVAEAVDASAGSEPTTFYLRVHDGDPGTHVGGYALNVIDADLVSLLPGRSTLTTVGVRARAAYRVEVPASKVGSDLRVTSRRRRTGGAAPEVRVVAPSGRVVVDFGQGDVNGRRASVALDEVGAWTVEVRSRDAKRGDVKLRAEFR